MTTFNDLINTENDSIEAITTTKPKIKVKTKKKLCECGKSVPSFNFPNIKKGICCNLCKHNNMISIKNKCFC